MRSEEVFFLPEPQRDRWDNVVGDQPDSISLGSCVVWPRESTEEGQGTIFLDGENVRVRWPSPVELKPDGRLLIRGEPHDIDGSPGLYPGKAVIVKTKRTRT